MADWSTIAKQNFEAARLLQEQQHRSCVSRYYYAAFSAVTSALAGRGVPAGYEMPRHRDVTRLIDMHFVGMSLSRRRALKAAIRRLCGSRLAADYRSGLTVDRRTALNAHKDAFTVCELLEVVV